MKIHKTALLNKERDLVAREQAAAASETSLASIIAAKDEEIASLRSLAASAENLLQTRVREAIARRDEELRAMVLKQEQEVAARIARREEEIMEAVRQREEEISRMWADWEAKTREAMTAAVEERMEWVRQQAEEMDRERSRLDDVREDLERKMSTLEAAERKGTSRSYSYAFQDVLIYIWAQVRLRRRLRWRRSAISSLHLLALRARPTQHPCDPLSRQNCLSLRRHDRPR